jgi:hypothetical protein
MWASLLLVANVSFKRTSRARSCLTSLFDVDRFCGHGELRQNPSARVGTSIRVGACEPSAAVSACLRSSAATAPPAPAQAAPTPAPPPAAPGLSLPSISQSERFERAARGEGWSPPPHIGQGGGESPAGRGAGRRRQHVHRAVPAGTRRQVGEAMKVGPIGSTRVPEGVLLLGRRRRAAPRQADRPGADHPLPGRGAGPGPGRPGGSLSLKRSSSSHYSHDFSLSVRLRGRDETLSTSGSCRNEGSSLTCLVECDGYLGICAPPTHPGYRAAGALRPGTVLPIQGGAVG